MTKHIKDTNIEHYMKIVNALKNPIWTLGKINVKYGTGFDLWRTGENEMTLELMDDDAKYGQVIDSITVEFDTTGLKMVNEVVTKFEKQLFERHSNGN